MKKFFSALFVVLFATSMMAQELGSSCENPIPVDSTYRARVEGPCELWYRAGTYDLPLNVHFVPDNPASDWGPEVEVDFTCDEGVYDDPKIDSLINMVGAFSVSFPLELLCDRAGTDEQVEWDLSVNETYRDQLAEFGVTYNVIAYVKVRFFEPGLIRLQPDTVYSSCMEIADPVVLDQEIAIAENDSDRVFVMPYTDWQNDSIQFVWTGNAPATIWLATGSCDFLPSTASGYVCTHYNVQPGIPYRVHNKDIVDLITSNTGGGIFYAKVLSAESGSLLTEKIPMSEIQGGATLLEYGQSVQLAPNASDELFCFPKTWGATQFIASTSKAVTMYISLSADFKASADDPNVVGVAPFGVEDNGRALYLSSKELSTYLSGIIEDYVYVRFVSEGAMTITPEMWSASVCADASTLIAPNTVYEVQARSGNTIFRMRYADFEGYPFSIYWEGSGSLPVYISDTCHYVLSGSNEHVLKYATVRNGKTVTTTAEDLASWESRAEDGYFYVRFNPSNVGDVTFLTDKPAEDITPTPDTVYTTETAAVCFGEAYEWNGKTYTETGEYTYTTVAANGADSIVTLNLTVYPQTEATTETVEVPFGTTYEWNGLTYTESGEYTTTLQDENGCDYEATLLLTILPEEKPEFAYPVVASSEEQLLINYPLATQVYGMEYLSWQAGDVTLAWSGATPLYVFIAKVADFAVAVHHKNVVKFIEIPAEGSVVLSKSEVQALSRYATEEGYLYVRFLTEKEGVLTTAQAE